LGFFVLSCSSVPPLGNAKTSAPELAESVLAALASRDRAALQQLTLTEQEFRDHAWPDLPAAQPERNLPFSYVWGDLRQKSEVSLGETLSEHGGRHLRLRNVRFEGETTLYDTYLVHRETVLTVVDESGMEQDLRLFGSMIEKDGAWKIFSYVVHD